MAIFDEVFARYTFFNNYFFANCSNLYDFKIFLIKIYA
jgi:hypothetical protein